METPSFLPCCPVCGATLEGVPFPTPKKGVGRCPAAGNYEFEVDVDENKILKDKFGNPMKVLQWSVTGDEH